MNNMGHPSMASLGCDVIAIQTLAEVYHVEHDDRAEMAQ